MTWMTRARRHISDEVLTALYVERCDDADLPADVASHLDACSACERRRDDLVALLDAVQTAAVTDAEASLTPARLLAQRHRILRRLATLVGSEAPAKVLRFPARMRPARTTIGQHGWLPAAMAAGLVLGVVAGRLFDGGPANRPEGVTTVASAAGDALVAAARSDALRGAQGVQNDETILTQIDTALETVSVSALSDLDALTPRIQEAALAGR